MANPKPKISFTKGDPRASLAGKKSSRALPPDLKEARQMFARDFESTIYKYMNHTKDELLMAMKAPETPAKDLAVLSILHKAITNGDQQRLDFMLNRTVGKVVEKVETVDRTNEHEQEMLAQKLLEIARKPE
jgi:hypothetical protein